MIARAVERCSRARLLCGRVDGEIESLAIPPDFGGALPSGPATGPETFLLRQLSVFRPVVSGPPAPGVRDAPGTNSGQEIDRFADGCKTTDSP
jgi:hypothetical protein